ncbi:hypothetical protein DL98DRAFT_658824 [Cadophora sp. DSE1049]|nr:hypothetical protein DL98DRAFT_658824 [Cadophora sp. DSE1049]
MVSPDDIALIAAIRAIRVQNPTLARALSEKRLKACMDTWDLGSGCQPPLVTDKKDISDIEPISQPNLSSGAGENGTENLRSASHTTPFLYTNKDDLDLPRDATFDADIKNTFQDFAKAEGKFRLNLSQDDLQALRPGHYYSPKFSKLDVACQQRHHIEILILLQGIKPCVGIHHHTATDTFTRLVNEVLKPIISKYSLPSYGFTLQQITQPTMKVIGRPSPVKFWQGG